MKEQGGALMKRYIKALDQLSSGEREEWHRVRHRMMQVCEAAVEKNIGVLIDAEDSWIQDPIDALIILMMDCNL